MSKYPTKLAGCTFDGRQTTIAFCHVDDPVTFKREPDNRYDGNAILVKTTHGDIGYVPKALAAHLAPRLDAGEVATGKITRITGGHKRYPSHGVDVMIEMAPNPRPIDDEIGF